MDEETAELANNNAGIQKSMHRRFCCYLFDFVDTEWLLLSDIATQVATLAGISLITFASHLR